MFQDTDLEETVVLIIMENPKMRLTEAWKIVKEIHPNAEASEVSKVWVAYKGADRIPPWKELPA